MDWVAEFYSVTDSWWGEAESAVRDIDQARARFVEAIAPESRTVLELGCGYGATAVAMGETGRSVVGVDLSDRVERATQRTDQPESVAFVRTDFYEFDAAHRFDVVCYWDGFGVGDDADQLQLLRRIRQNWLADGGRAIIEVYHPSGWIADAGLDEIKEPSPDDGYRYRLGHRRGFDHVRSRAMDTWWEIGTDDIFTQTLRCYEPAELAALAEDAGLRVEVLAESPQSPEPLHDSGQPESPQSPESPHDSGQPRWSYLAVLVSR